MVLLESIRTQQIEETLLLTDLQRALLKAGVKILNTDDVKVYQAAKLAEERGKLLNRKPWIAALALPALAAAVLVACHVPSPVTGFVPFVLSLLGITFFVLVAIGAVVVARPPRRMAETLDWREYLIGEHFGSLGWVDESYSAPGVGRFPVPVEAQAICHRVAAAGARATFNVRQLDTDPFLVVENRDDCRERYYLFAWGEEGYLPR
jgi:hypothetical protein